MRLQLVSSGMALVIGCGGDVAPARDAASDGDTAIRIDGTSADGSVDTGAPSLDAVTFDAMLVDAGNDVPVVSVDVVPAVDVTPPPPPIPTCIATNVIGNAGGSCSGIDQVFTARGVNVGYYPFRVLAPVVQYSGDFDGTGTAVFVPGASRKGVILQTIPAGAYIGLSTIPGNYNPPTGCDTTACGAPGRAACGDSAPALRAPVAGFYWGYGYQGASHMQGWIGVPSGALEFAGFDAAHPCALGPAGLDYEIASACGTPTSCHGTNPTCGATNPCTEGGDDCGNAACGSMGGGPLTPSAWHRTVSAPSGDHACTLMTPPNPSVTCLGNGGLADFFFVYPFGAYLYWAQNSTTRAWLHYGDRVQLYYHNRDSAGVLWDFVEVLSSGAPVLTPPSDGAGGGAACDSAHPANCHPCQNGGTCGWVQDVFLGP